MRTFRGLPGVAAGEDHLHAGQVGGFVRSEVEDGAGDLLRGKELVRRIGPGQLEVPIRYRNTKGQEFATPVLDILTHVVIHGAYHRGQIAKCIGRCGGVAVNTDFITFAREVEPARA